MGFTPTLKALSYLHCLSRDPISKCSHILRYWRLGLEHVSLGGTVITGSSGKSTPSGWWLQGREHPVPQPCSPHVLSPPCSGSSLYLDHHFASPLHSDPQNLAVCFSLQAQLGDCFLQEASLALPAQPARLVPPLPHSIIMALISLPSCLSPAPAYELCQEQDRDMPETRQSFLGVKNQAPGPRHSLRDPRA